MVAHERAWADLGVEEALTDNVLVVESVRRMAPGRVPPLSG